MSLLGKWKPIYCNTQMKEDWKSIIGIFIIERVWSQNCVQIEKIIESKFYTFVRNDDGEYDVIKWVNWQSYLNENLSLSSSLKDGNMQINK